MKLTRSERKELQDKLHFGDIARVSRAIGKSRSTVKRWLKGESDSPELADAFSKLIKQRERSSDLLRNTLGMK